MNAIDKNDQNPFIEIQLNGEIQLGVNARDLHKMLEVKTDFSDWIKRRIKQCKFEEQYDFIVFLKKGENLNGGRPTTEYIISVDMTKHLGMMEGNDKGQEIRKYYIEQEKIVRGVNNSIQVEVGKAMQQLNYITISLSDAARYLNIVGKQVKPALMRKIDDMIEQTQHQLDFDSPSNFTDKT
jgi:anti-repressor protein